MTSSTGSTTPVSSTPASPTGDIRDLVREKYGAIVEGSKGCCGEEAGGCGCGDCGDTRSLGYTEEQIQAIPEGSNFGLGCGNPLGHAAAKPGETVLDLGSGAGIDVFIASRDVGPGGFAIGVDMTPSMVSRARANAREGGYTNVEFRLGEIERLPVADASVDLIISNCVINLSPDKPAVFREAARVLRPGARLVVSDIVLSRELPESVRRSVESYAGCVAGASLKDEYLRFIREAGFDEVEVLEERTYGVPETLLPGADPASVGDSLRSMKVRAVKPRA
jgi:SAM-dependent methyltransferase